MNLSFVLSLETGLYGLVHAHKLICSDTWALLQQKEYDYVVHFVHRHLLDRCICWANLDRFSDWILNQNNIFPVPPCFRILRACHTCCLPLKSFIDKMVMRDSWLRRRILAEWWACMRNVSKIYLQTCTRLIKRDGVEGNLFFFVYLCPSITNRTSLIFFVYL